MSSVIGNPSFLLTVTPCSTNFFERFVGTNPSYVSCMASMNNCVQAAKSASVGGSGSVFSAIPRSARSVFRFEATSSTSMSTGSPSVAVPMLTWSLSRAYVTEAPDPIGFGVDASVSSGGSCAPGAAPFGVCQRSQTYPSMKFSTRWCRSQYIRQGASTIWLTYGWPTTSTA